MKVAASRFRHAVVVAPHPDDEIIGAAALIRELRLHRCKVTVIVVSDGAGSHRSSVRWPPKKLIAERRRESLCALRRLSVLPGQVRFLGLPDGRLAPQIDECKRRLARAIRTVASPDLIVGPVAFDDHPDHRAVALALRPAGRGRVSYGYGVWPPRIGFRGIRRTAVMRGGSIFKRSVIRVHRSQLGAIKDDPSGFAIARHELEAFSHPIERFMVRCP